MIKARVFRAATASSVWICTRCTEGPAPRTLRRLSASRSFYTNTPTFTRSLYSDLRRRFQRRHASEVAAQNPSAPVDASVSGTHDDANLREIFDFNKSNIMSSLSQWAKPSIGLFKNKYLTDAHGFLIFAQRNLERAQVLVDKIRKASSIDDYKVIVRDLDRLSDLLCRVLDLCDFVRMTHPDSSIQEASSHAWAMAYQYMNTLNTMPALHDQLSKAMSIPKVSSSWSDEERTVAEILKNDFMKSGIHLPKQQRQRFVELSQKISESGTRFAGDARPALDTLVMPASSFSGLYPPLASALTINGRLHMPLLGREAATALRTVHDEDCRKSIYMAGRTASPYTIRDLETMLTLRGELAQLAGFESYGHHTLKDRMMAKTPHEVMKFLLALREHNLPKVQDEVRKLRDRKRDKTGNKEVQLNAWDKDYYVEITRNSYEEAKVKYQDTLDAYFSVGTVMQGMSRLFNRLYGVRFVPGEAEPGETWHPDVRRLDVFDDIGNKLAVLYCDLFSRPGKASNPAHYTLRCAREILSLEVAEAASTMSHEGLPSFASPEEAANDGMAAATRDGTLRQLPTIALVCDFHKIKNSGKAPATLSYYQVETLFHEMGHAVHSILAQSSFQNVAGTRCATDFAELPSTLMEHFSADQTVLSLFARHWKTDEPLLYKALAEKLRQTKHFAGMDTEHQLILAMVDQAYHSSSAGKRSGFNSTQIFHDIEDKYAVCPTDPPSTCWQGFFGHLYGYGATYYSYLFDRVLAERVWKTVFKSGENQGAISRDNGEHLKDNLLKWGGSRDPWVCLADTLKDEKLRKGGEEAMAIVGSWGV